uniref:Uncharacterized protein n=1 Tax=Rhodococcus hoagii TaxID=43767 RepID=A0A0F7ICE5_RHOHA|nr:hypothetical protein pVAPN2012_0740 [Prescottella equi]AKG90528.1 hypothetical protein pVAPN_0740 [Prescottella equi]ARX59679.1 hypothetical protein pVAPN1204_0740 [Prescottella equi]ARX59822.1 hypothetical protein pVAPN1354_0740 [Prescottella equi]ARX59969.1 hypothetical protein pVAPN1557_0740 [Prescottella equi]
MRESLHNNHALTDLNPAPAAAHYCTSSAPHVIVSNLDAWAAYEACPEKDSQNLTP